MPDRRLPVRPDLTQLKHQAKDLLRALKRAEPSALADLQRYHPHPPAPAEAKLADAQLVLARSYQAPSWPRLALACRLVEAIWQDDVATVRDLITTHPALLHEPVLIRESNWGPPLSYAANLGRDGIIALLREAGATDLHHALGRALLQGRIATARTLHAMLGSPRPPVEAFGGPAYTLNVPGTELLFELGATVWDAQGAAAAPVAVVLESDSRKPEAKHRILELYAHNGQPLPDTAPMALHRGRVDLLTEQLRRDPELLRRTFTFEEIFPPALGCHQEDYPRTPLDGVTLLHLCVEFDELEMARWLLGRGMKVDVPAAVDRDGFGGQTALFHAVVCYANFWRNYTGDWSRDRPLDEAPFANLLLEHGADPSARASLREIVWSDEGGTDRRVTAVREHRGVTPRGWGDAFHNRMVVSEPALRLIEARGGRR